MEEQPILEIGEAKLGIKLAQVPHRAPRFIPSAGERMTCRNDADRDEKTWQVSQRLLGPRRRLVEATRAQVCERRSALHSIHFEIEGTPAHGVSQPFNGVVGFAPHDLHEAAEEPGGCQIWIKEQSLIDKRNAAVDVAYEIRQRVSSAGKSDSIILAELDRAMG